MSEVLNRARQAQREFAHNTTVVIRLDMLEDLIAEIEALHHRLDALSQNHQPHKLRPAETLKQQQGGGP